jgi:hypothetical protein
MALTRTIHCSDAAAAVAKDGAAVLSSAPHVFDRYVSGVNLCLKPEFIERATVPTIDSARCFRRVPVQHQRAAPGRRGRKRDLANVSELVIAIFLRMTG